jgi:hypothetical protein
VPELLRRHVPKDLVQQGSQPQARQRQPLVHDFDLLAAPLPPPAVGGDCRGEDAMSMASAVLFIGVLGWDRSDQPSVPVVVLIRRGGGLRPRLASGRRVSTRCRDTSEKRARQEKSPWCLSCE